MKQIQNLVPFFVLCVASYMLYAAEPLWNSSSNGMKWRILQSGSGEKIQEGDMVTVHYRGWVQKGGKRSPEPFDDSHLRDEPLRFPLGAGEVIKGWDIGLVGMQQGEERELLIPPSLGYGDRDLGIIPPKSWLLFQVVLLNREAGLPPDTLFDQNTIAWHEVVPGVELFDQKEGSGPEAKDGDHLSLHYTGWLTGGTRFVSSKIFAKPAETLLGSGQSIPGWEIALKGMKRGGIRLMRIQPYMGYGAQVGPKIPPHSTLLFKVELLELQGVEESDQFDLFPDLASLQWRDQQGVQVATVQPGAAQPAAQKGSQVAVHYTGWMVDGNRFDSSRSRGKPFVFTLAAGQVISGWDLGVVGMTPGEKRVLKIPSSLAYGAQGSGAIPPHSDLIFAVEMVSIEPVQGEK